MAHSKPEVVLEDGRLIQIDLNRITVAEWRRLFDPSQLPEEEDEILSKAAGMTAEEWRSLGLADWRKVSMAILEKGRNPLSDPF